MPEETAGPFICNLNTQVASGAKTAITAFDWVGLILISFVLPAVICGVLGAWFRKKGWIEDGDLKLN